MVGDSRNVVYELFRLEITESGASLQPGWATTSDTPRHVRRDELLFCQTQSASCVVVPETRFRLFTGIGSKAPMRVGGMVTKCATQPRRLKKANVSLQNRMPVSEVFDAKGRVGQAALVAVVELTTSAHEASRAVSIQKKVGPIEEYGRGQIEQTLGDGTIMFGGYTVLELGRNSSVDFRDTVSADSLSYRPTEPGSSLVLV